MKRSLIFIVAIMFFSGCSGFSSGASERESSIKDVIPLDQCKRPCWLGMEQGMTVGVNDVEQILKGYYGTENASINDIAGKNPTFGFSSVGWRISDKSDSIPLQYGSITLSEKSQVHSINVWFEEQWFTVDDLLSVVGEPDLAVMNNVNNYPNGSPCDVWQLHYPKVGLRVIVWQGEKVGKITESEYIASLHFSKSWLSNEIPVDRNFEKLVVWNGLGDYGEHCSKIKLSNP